jgi:acyl carrier protein
MSRDIQGELLEFICKNFMVEKDEIELEKSLVDTGIIDSIGLIEISTFIQNTFNIVVHENQMNRDNFGSVVKIVKFIEKEIS